jgi:hypothetical protein
MYVQISQDPIPGEYRYSHSSRVGSIRSTQRLESIKEKDTKQINIKFDRSNQILYRIGGKGGGQINRKKKKKKSAKTRRQRGRDVEIRLQLIRGQRCGKVRNFLPIIDALVARDIDRKDAVPRQQGDDQGLVDDG